MKKFNIKINNHTYDVNVISMSAGTAEVDVNGVHYQVKYEEFIDRQALISQIKQTASSPPLPPPRPMQTTARAAAPAAEGSLIAPMPGLIMKVYVKEGDQVTEGQIVIKMEAMKMENEIPSPASGTVIRINVEKGDTVQDGDVMLVIGGAQ